MRAMILAAGRGERMRPLTDHCPKPLLQAGGKPLLEWHIEALVAAGIVEIGINLAHLGQHIEQYFGNGHGLGAHLQYSWEVQALETAGGIRNALPLLAPNGSQQPFLVLNGDVHCDWNVRQAVGICNAWPIQEPAPCLAHLVLVNNPTHNAEGDFALQAHRVFDKTTSAPHYTFSGIGVYSPQLFQPLPLGQACKLAPLLRTAMANGKVNGELHSGCWMDIGTPERLNELNHLLQAKTRKHHAQ